jgi:uncharacterized repeat protein (TIGR03943 family)
MPLQGLHSEQQLLMQPIKHLRSVPLQPVLETVIVIGLGLMLLIYRLKNQLVLLIHSNYVGLAALTGVALLGLGLYRLIRLVMTGRNAVSRESHDSFFAPPVAIALLLITVMLGVIITPRPLSSQTALNRGVSQNLGISRDQPQEFRPRIDPSQRSLIDWVRTLEVYPDPITYTDQPVHVQGFVIHSPEAPAGTFILARFLIRCCAADAYPVGLPVQWQGFQDLASDSWQEVKGRMKVTSLAGKPELIIAAESVTTIPIPINPYAY